MGIGGGAEQEDRGAAGGPRAERGAENSASSDGGAEEFGLEKLGDEIGDGHRAPAQKIEDAFLAEASDVAAGGFGVVVVEQERAAVRRRSENARIGIEDLQILLVEAHVAHDVGTERAGGVRER